MTASVVDKRAVNATRELNDAAATLERHVCAVRAALNEARVAAERVKKVDREAE